MPEMNVILEGDNCWPDLKEKMRQGLFVDLMGDNAPPIGVARLTGGMQSGKSSVTIRIDLPDGRTVLTETSLALFGAAADAMRARDEVVQDRN